MNEQKRYRALNVTLLVYIVDIQRPEAVNLDAPRKHRQLVELGFVLPPVVSILPPRDEPLQICERHTILPACVVELIREADEIELLLQSGNVAVWNGDLEGSRSRHSGV